MRRLMALMLILAVLTAIPTAASAAPPARPLAVTSSQFGELQKTQAAPEHVAVLDVHASFKSEHEKQLERTRMADDISSGVMLIGYPTLIICLLFAAAPL